MPVMIGLPAGGSSGGRVVVQQEVQEAERVNGNWGMLALKTGFVGAFFKGRALLWLVGCMGLLLTGWAYHVEQDQLRKEGLAEFTWAARDRFREVANELDQRVDHLRARVDDHMDHAEWEEFQFRMSIVFDESPAVLGLQWIDQETGSQRTRLLSREKGAPPLSVDQLGDAASKRLLDRAGGGHVPVVDYLPPSNQENALMIVAVASYLREDPPAGAGERDQHLHGYWVVFLDLQKLIATALQDLKPYGIHFWLSDPTPGTGGHIYMHRSRSYSGSDVPSFQEAEQHKSPWHFDASIQIGDQTWLFTAVPAKSIVTDPSLFSSERLMKTVLSDLTITFLVLFLLWYHQKQSALTRHLLELADAGSRSKSAFIAHMSHEMRTPLNAVIGLSDLALKLRPTAPFDDYLGKINGSAHLLMSLIDDILNFSRSESGQMRLDPTEFNPSDLFGRLGDMLAGQLEKKPVELIFSLPPDFCRTLYGDALRLEQILINLIMNAIKFTPEGGILVRVDPIQEPIPGPVRLRFSVWDTGIGIAPEALANLFEPFVQADGSITRQFGGTGLGLAICKRLTALMGGEIQVESSPGNGSTFRFSVVMECRSTPAENQHALPMDLEGKKILVVDDSPLFLEVVEQLLSAWRLDVLLALSGPEALERIEQTNQSGQAVDLVLLDWRMPQMDGVEVARQIRAKFGEKQQIVMVTAFGNEEVRQQAKQVGIVHFLQKPVTESHLFNTLLEIFHGTAQPARWSERSLMEETAARVVLQGAHLLLVDDNVINQQVGLELLQRVGVQVTVAGNGQEALEKLENAAFDGVLMDMQMPVMDGLEATRQIRLRPQWQTLPVIAMTAHALDEARQACQAAGMNGHLAKPIQPNRLYALLTHWVTTHSATPGQADEQPALPEEPLPEIPGVDAALGLAHTGGNPAFLKKLFIRFAEQQAHTVAQLQTALANGEIEVAAHIAHSIKGLAGSLGAVGLQQAALALEEAIQRDGATDPHYRDAFSAALRDILQAVARWPTLTPGSQSGALARSAEGLPRVEARLRERVQPLLTELAALLRENSLETETVLTALKDLLPSGPAAASCLALEQEINDYNFDAARQAIQHLAALLELSLGED